MLNRIPFQYRITLLYIVFGALWIIFSDELVAYFFDDSKTILKVSTYKGWLFVLVTGIMLFGVIGREIKRRSQLFNELNAAKEKADEADRLRTTFLANLSHYIRTPMNSILGFIELYQEKDTSEKNHQLYLSYINESSQNLLQTLTSIIEIAKIQEGHVKIDKQPVNLNELLESAANLSQIEISQKKRPISVSISLGLPAGKDVFSIDRNKLLLILSSLLNNAVSFTKAGEISIGYSLSGSDLRFWVSDTGPGVPGEKQATLFTNIFQKSENTSTYGEGPGLSLPLSASIAKLLHGNLWLEKSGPEGSTFMLSIPVY